VTAPVRIPALVRGNELITDTGLFGGFIRAAQAAERGPHGLAAGMFIGNPVTDVLDLATNSFVVENGDEAWAAQEALKLAEELDAAWDKVKLVSAPAESGFANTGLGRGFLGEDDGA